MPIYLTEYTGTLNGDRYAADNIEATSWEEAETIAQQRGVKLVGEFVGCISFGRPSVDGRCPLCGYEHDHEGLDLKIERSGTAFDGEISAHWFDAIATCPSCGHKFPYSDSST